MPDQLTLDRSVVTNLLHHAVSAAHLVGHLDNAIADGPLAEHVDTLVHGLTEILREADAAAPDDRAVYNGAPMLASSAGGGR
jgi:hypothetical protein